METTPEECVENRMGQGGLWAARALAAMSEAALCLAVVLWREWEPEAAGLALGIWGVARLLGHLVATRTALGPEAAPVALVLAGAAAAALGWASGWVFLAVLALHGLLAALADAGKAGGSGVRGPSPVAAGAVAGPLLAGILPLPKAVFPVCGALAAAAGILLGIYKSKATAGNEIGEAPAAGRDKKPPVAKTSYKIQLWAALLVAGLANGGLVAVFPLLAREGGIGPLGTGAALALQAAVGAAVFWLGRRFLPKSVLSPAPAFCLGFIAVAFCLAQKLDAALPILGFFAAQGLALGTLWHQARTVASADPQDGARRKRVCDVAFLLGWPAGAVAGGWAFQKLGWSNLAWSFGMAAAALGVVGMLLVQYGHRVEVADYVSHFNDKEKKA